MIRAVLFDRDGTLIADDPSGERIDVMLGARYALDMLRSHGMRIGVATNQPRLAGDGVFAQRTQEVHATIESLLGRFDGWFVCPHAADAGCLCRKPKPGLILQAASAFGVQPREIAMIGDIGTDVDAARAAGAFPILVPTAVTRREEIERAPLVCPNVIEAAALVLAELAA